MPRYKRIREPGFLRHVMSRGNGRMQIFLDETDYTKFLVILSDVLDACDVDCWDLCLMPNHYHLTLMNRQPNLSRAMQALNGEYAMWWNGRHGKVGHVFQGRYKDQIVQHQGYFFNLLRYLALNPVRAGLVKRAEQWPWSGFRWTGGFAPAPRLVCSDTVLAQFGDGAVEMLQERYIRHVVSSLSDDNERFQEFRSRKRILGDRQFTSSVRRKLVETAAMETSVASAVVVG